MALFLGQLEFNRMSLGAAHRLPQIVAALAGTTIVPLLYFQQQALLLPWTVCVFLLLALVFLYRFKTLTGVHNQLGWICLGLFYLPILFGHLLLLRFEPFGRQWIFLTMMTVMFCDSFAYFVGRKIGRHKLYPSVSPNKSVEGGVAGLVGSVIAVFIAKALFLPQIGWLDGLVMGITVSLFGQSGDLFESLLKRACGVKDSGTMIPGHGGLLDRLDSLLFAFPVMYYIVKYGYGG